ncbi:hypothetical protein ACEWY4_007557 [Coilia grayii]|uniref:Enoyl reductase (ER) domain-containing protein n=1 Tax=Coilia grayii TaxID=363190 RepID=A0ABD1KGK5_9TELE
MRAIRVAEFGGPSVLKLYSDVPIPSPGHNQVLIRIYACGVNPVETYIRSGSYTRKPSVPYTPGSDVSGVIEAVGDGVKSLQGKVYGEISDELAGVGYHRTVDQITNKLKKIKKDYRDYKANLARSGVGRNKFKSGINITLLDNVLGTRPANQTEGALNSAVAATASTSGQSQTATEILEAMCQSDPSGYEDTNELDISTTELSAAQCTPTPTTSGSRKGKRKSQQDLLECMERMEEQRDRRFLEQTKQLNDAFLRRMDSTNAALVALLGRYRVFATATETGGYAEYAVACEDAVYLLPDCLDFNQGAAIGIPYFTAYRALFHKAHAKAGESVLIHGASGGVGIAACQLSRSLGLRVLGTAGTVEGMELVLKNGAHQAFNHREKDYVTKIKEATNNQGINVIIEMLSNINLANDLQMLSYGGRVAIVGCRGPIEINPRDIMSKESSISGVALFFATQEETAECAVALFAGMEAGWLKPVIGPQYPLEKASQAHEDIITGPAAAGKIVLIM